MPQEFQNMEAKEGQAVCDDKTRGQRASLDKDIKRAINSAKDRAFLTNILYTATQTRCFTDVFLT